MPKRRHWQVTVRYLADGTMHRKVFAGHEISAQVFEGDIPRRAYIEVFNQDGDVVETFQCDYQSIHRRRAKR